MPKKLALAIAWLTGAAAFAVPVLLALYLSDQQALRLQESQAARLAQQLVQRNEVISRQVVSAIRTLEVAGTVPCSPANLELMRQMAVTASHLQAIGYVHEDRLMCSSLGLHGDGIPLGPADYLSLSGYYIRKNITLPFGGATRFRLSTAKDSGYAAISHLGLATDVIPPESGIDGGLVGVRSKQLLFGKGEWHAEWLARLGEAPSASWLDGDRVVALQRSQQFDYAGYVALPAASLREDRRAMARLLVPAGIGVGLLLALAVYLVAKRQTSPQQQLRNALRRGQLFLVYQPIVALESGRWVGAEALLRWRGSDGALVPPDVFIPLAEKCQLMRAISARVIELFARDCPALLKRHPDFYISLNFSAADFDGDATITLLQDSLASKGLAPHNVCVEATERELMDSGTTHAAMARLRGMGIQIALDDFGTGYSSLSYLHALQLDTLKIDKSFVDKIGTDSATSPMVDHIIGIAKELRLAMVAEGVEEERQAAYLRAKGVQLAQGWLFARPLEVQELAAALEARQG